MTEPARLQIGRIHLYAGTGAGDAPSWLGLTARCLGAGMRARVIACADDAAAAAALDLLSADATFGARLARARPADLATAAADARAAVAAGEVALVVLAGALAEGADTAPLRELLDAHRAADPRPAVELVLTGPSAPAELVERADLVTDLRRAERS